MRIGKKSGGFNTSGSRAEAFRKSHKVGQKVRGRVLKWQDAAMAWIAIDGNPLLASLNSHPAPGAILTFKIISLHPQIHLQEVFDGGASLPKTVTSVMDFTTARRHFETLMEPHSASLTGLPFTEKCVAFAELLGLTDLKKAYAAVLSSVDNVNTGDRKYTLHYTPLYLPVARDQTTFQSVGSTGLHEIVHEFTLPSLGDAQLQCLHKHGETSFRLKLRKTTHHKEMRHLLTKSEMLSPNARCIGVESLSGPPGGMLARFLAPR